MEVRVLLSLLLEPTVLFFSLLVSLYLIAIKNINQPFYKNKDFYSVPDWNYALKNIWARNVLRRWKKSLKIKDTQIHENEDIKVIASENDSDTQVFWGTNSDGASLFINFTRKHNQTAEVTLILMLGDGTRFYLPNQPDTVFYDNSSNSWSAGGLTLIPLRAFTRWRIIFNGILTRTCKDEWSDTFTDTTHAKFNFIWCSATEIIHIPEDNSIPLMAEALALEPWKHPYWMTGITDPPVRGHDQFGSLFGSLTFSDLDDLQPLTLCLHGIKTRRWRSSAVQTLRRSFTLMGCVDDGSIFHIGLKSYNGLTHVKFGSLRFKTGEVWPIDKCDTHLSLIGEYFSRIPTAFTINFLANHRHFKLVVHTNEADVTRFRGGRPWTWENRIITLKCGFNGIQGTGILQLWDQYHGSCPLSNLPSRNKLEWVSLDSIDSDVTCVAFEEPACRCPALVGGKGASLALLTSLQATDFEVPKGFCLTTQALEKQISLNPFLQEALKRIKDVNLDYNERALKDACQLAVNLFTETPVCDEVKEAVTEYYTHLCASQGEAQSIYFAVRSSGIGEDSEELSAAGQNASILGCSKLYKVIKAIQECWASLFTFQSVGYRRQHGQPVECGMGVVVQVVVHAHAAGVLFSREPTTGDPTRILITSNYGLGESVVSGKVEPDSIIVEKDLKNNLSIKSIGIGRKTHQIVIDEIMASGVTTMELDQERSGAASVSEEECLRLARIAVEQEHMWAAPRDIEWAIGDNGEIYLLQVRPITSINQWTEFELCHEFDTPVMTNQDLVTFANTGEVLPGATSPLSHSTVGSTLDSAVTESSGSKPCKYSFVSFGSTHYHISLNFHNTFSKTVDREITVAQNAMDIAIFGHIVTDEKVHAVALHRYGSINIINKFIKTVEMAVYTFLSKRKSISASIRANNFSIELEEGASLLDMYSTIKSKDLELKQTTSDHNYTTAGSMFSQIILFQVLVGNKSGFSLDNYADISMILSSARNVVSGEVPDDLAKLATQIRRQKIDKEFIKQRPENVMTWLQQNHPSISDMFGDFLKKHGHRSIKEFDLLTDTWGVDPISLIKSLQTQVSVPDKPVVEDPNKDKSVHSRLVSSLSFVGRVLLLLVIPLCQKTLSEREVTKAAIILMVKKLRVAYTQLAEQMVKEWRLPDKKLIFFFTCYELGEYLRTSNPAYINRAMLRRRHFSKWEKLKFPEMNWGFPQPLDLAERMRRCEQSPVSCLKGTPVYPGTIVGRACVIHNVEQTDELKENDILITNSTDIGWSPYFPFLGGVVTELGGLISHGAVVAREYGLPCIVGVQDATFVFKTGDTVRLNATKGLIEKVTE